MTSIKIPGTLAQHIRRECEHFAQQHAEYAALRTLLDSGETTRTGRGHALNVETEDLDALRFLRTLCTGVARTSYSGVPNSGTLQKPRDAQRRTAAQTQSAHRPLSRAADHDKALETPQAAPDPCPRPGDHPWP